MVLWEGRRRLVGGAELCEQINTEIKKRWGKLRRKGRLEWWLRKCGKNKNTIKRWGKTEARRKIRLGSIAHLVRYSRVRAEMMNCTTATSDLGILCQHSPVSGCVPAPNHETYRRKSSERAWTTGHRRRKQCQFITELCRACVITQWGQQLFLVWRGMKSPVHSTIKKKIQCFGCFEQKIYISSNEAKKYQYG